MTPEYVVHAIEHNVRYAPGISGEIGAAANKAFTKASA